MGGTGVAVAGRGVGVKVALLTTGRKRPQPGVKSDDSDGCAQEAVVPDSGVGRPAGHLHGTEVKLPSPAPHDQLPVAWTWPAESALTLPCA